MSNNSRKNAKAKASNPAKPAPRVFATNRRATYEYEILDTYEAGLALLGTEVKSIRQSKVSLQEAYAAADQGELWLYNLHIAPYLQAGPSNHSPLRPRKLLLHRWQLEELIDQSSRKGLTIVPLRIYLKRRRVKIALALGRGKRRYQKKQTLIDRAMEQETQQALKERSGRS